MPCMKHCLRVKNLKCIAKLRIFGIIRDKFNAVENCENYGEIFMVAPCINNIRHFIVQLMHTNYKILRLLK